MYLVTGVRKRYSLDIYHPRREDAGHSKLWVLWRDVELYKSLEDIREGEWEYGAVLYKIDWRPHALHKKVTD